MNLSMVSIEIKLFLIVLSPTRFCMNVGFIWNEEMFVLVVGVSLLGVRVRLSVIDRIGAKSLCQLLTIHNKTIKHDPQ